MCKAPFTVVAIALLSACGGGGEPGPANPDEPNDSVPEATPVGIGTPVVARIASATDVDFYAFTVPAGGATVRFQTFDAGGVACDPTGAHVDPFIVVYDATPALRGSDDNSGVAPWCDDLTVVALPEGTSYVMIGGNPDASGATAFDYTLLITTP